MKKIKKRKKREMKTRQVSTHSYTYLPEISRKEKKKQTRKERQKEK